MTQENLKDGGTKMQNQNSKSVADKINLPYSLDCTDNSAKPDCWASIVRNKVFVQVNDSEPLPVGDLQETKVAARS